MNRKIRRARRATDQILALGTEARDHLQTAFTGHVLSRCVDLAVAALARAAVLVAATDWPNDRDYDDETNCPLFASGGETSLQTAALLGSDGRQSGADETACLLLLKESCFENSAVAAKAEAVENCAVAGEAEAVEDSAVAGKAEAVENSAVAGKAETVENCAVAGEAEAVENSAVAGDADAVENCAVAGDAEAVENSAVAGDADAVENSAVAGKAEAVENSAVAGEAEAVENSAVVGKAEAVENSAFAGKAESDQKITFPLVFLYSGGGLLAAIVCAAICWVVVDAIVPVAANVGLGFFMESWRASPSFYEFINVVDVCALANVFLFRAETIVGASVLLIGFRVGYQIRQLIAVGARPVISIVMVNFVMMVLICITLALLVLDVSPTVVPRSCEFPLFDQRGAHF
jgi:hypothetical protein